MVGNLVSLPLTQAAMVGNLMEAACVYFSQQPNKCHIANMASKWSGNCFGGRNTVQSKNVIHQSDQLSSNWNSGPFFAFTKLNNEESYPSRNCPSWQHQWGMKLMILHSLKLFLNRPDSWKFQFLTKLPAPSFAEGMLWLQMQVTHILWHTIGCVHQNVKNPHTHSQILHGNP